MTENAANGVDMDPCSDHDPEVFAEREAQGCIAMRGGGWRHSFINDGACVYCQSARVIADGF